MKQRDIFSTSMPVLIMDKKSLYTECDYVGSGAEGTVYKLNESTCFKILDGYARKDIKRKFEKIELLSKLKDKSFCFPKGIVYINGLKEGYYMDSVYLSLLYKDFDYLFYKTQLLKDVRFMLKYIKDADSAIRRIHQKGVVIGDINASNILIDENDNTKFIDTDNYRYQDYDFDLDPPRAHYLEKIYKRKFSGIENDKFVFALMTLQLLYPKTGIFTSLQDPYYINFIGKINASKEVKEGLRLILSDAEDKPYISEVINKIEINKTESDDRVKVLSLF